MGSYLPIHFHPFPAFAMVFGRGDILAFLKVSLVMRLALAPGVEADVSTAESLNMLMGHAACPLALCYLPYQPEPHSHWPCRRSSLDKTLFCLLSGATGNPVEMPQTLLSREIPPHLFLSLFWPKPLSVASTTPKVQGPLLAPPCLLCCQPFHHAHHLPIPEGLMTLMPLSH